MSYVAEPYAQFVDDLLTGLTGGYIRESFRMLEAEKPFRLSADSGILPNSVRVFGQVEAANGGREFRRFTLKTDFTLSNGRDITWQADPGHPDSPSADALWPVEGSVFYVNYEANRPAGAAPLLTDRSPGSVTRLLAESIGREYAVLSGQLEKVYQAGFLDTATGRDLDNLVALVGLTRKSRSVAGGTVTFSRRTPAPADITIAVGTRLSTHDVPAATFETTATATLQRGRLSVDVPVQALVGGSSGVVLAGSIVAVNRPVLGIDTVTNTEATRFAGQEEGDAALRMRARRSLDHAGKATVGALVGALTSLPGVREKDIRFSEDPIEHPGIVNLDLALPKMPSEQAKSYEQRAIDLLEESRPVGVRIRHNIKASLPPGEANPGSGYARVVGDPVTLGNGSGDSLHMPVNVNVTLQPVTLALIPEERERLARLGKQVVEDFIADAGLGETLVYNRLVSLLIGIDGVLDVGLEWRPTQSTLWDTRNIMPNQTGARPIVGTIDVRVGNALVALDVTVTVRFTGAGTTGNSDDNASNAALEIGSDLQQALDSFAGGKIDQTTLQSLAGASESYQVTKLEYRVEYVDAGVRVNQMNPTLPYTGLERFWVRHVNVKDEGKGSTT
ncbi:Baseplate J-like protein [Thiothrix caldifontis]|uniref:Baseplate J-like protein n=1 Tax=Thiothrix caldifontis TaxID=525918 RepID=A0A1H4APJ6_9GAMM|nr:baseplate J/gp47 family protein [Thiothrix caldifontis]SEA37624.1 Baseplate J-like protein [Thiothrix caldifontis]